MPTSGAIEASSVSASAALAERRVEGPGSGEEPRHRVFCGLAQQLAPGVRRRLADFVAPEARQPRARLVGAQPLQRARGAPRRDPAEAGGACRDEPSPRVGRGRRRVASRALAPGPRARSLARFEVKGGRRRDDDPRATRVRGTGQQRCQHSWNPSLVSDSSRSSLRLRWSACGSCCSGGARVSFPSC